MKNTARIEELNQTLDSFWMNEFYTIILVVTIALLLCSLIFKKKLLHAVAAIFIVFSIMAMFVISIEKTRIEGLLDQLEIISDVNKFEETDTLLVTNVINKQKVDSSYCPQVDLSDSEHCTYIEFISDKEITQVFVPVSKTVYADKDNPLTVEYLKVPKKEMDSIYEVFQFNEKSIDGEGKHSIYKDSWAFALSIK